MMPLVPEVGADDSWKPDGWSEWSPKRRAFWRRERQAERMQALDVDDQASRDLIVGHLLREAEDLRQAVALEQDGPPDNC